VEKGFVNVCKCVHCGTSFEAKRNDAVRCSSCRDDYLKAYRKLDTTKERRKQQYVELRKQALEGYGSKCACCEEDRFEFLAIDHVNGGGRKERETKSTQQIARKIINLNFPKEYRVLCHNCNQAIGWYGKCPHEIERTA
jgi:hypothetical protein